MRKEIEVAVGLFILINLTLLWFYIMDKADWNYFIFELWANTIFLGWLACFYFLIKN